MLATIKNIPPNILIWVNNAVIPTIRDTIVPIFLVPSFLSRGAMINNIDPSTSNTIPNISSMAVLITVPRPLPGGLVKALVAIIAPRTKLIIPPTNAKY